MAAEGALVADPAAAAVEVDDGAAEEEDQRRERNRRMGYFGESGPPATDFARDP